MGDGKQNVLQQAYGLVAATAPATFIEQQIKKMETIHHGAFEHDIFVFGERYHELWQHIEQPFVIFV